MARNPVKEHQQFGLLITVCRAGKNKHGQALWWCKCVCGNTKQASAPHLKLGKVKSCGCATDRLRSESLIKHGFSHTPEYHVWYNMMQRCLNPEHKSYKDYGARGISVSVSWREFEAFYADMGERPRGKTLDRVDNDKDYSSENCRWATALEQGQNKRNNRLVTRDDRTQTVAAWCRELGLNPQTVKSRIHRREPAEDWFRPSTRG